MKLIHCADIHLDSPMQTHMTAQQASVRNTEMLQSFVRLTEFAQERAVRAVLIAGDLFDGARVRARTVDALLAAIRRTPEVDYLYLPGNHDEAANAFCDCALPENLKVFGKKWTTYRYDGIAISGAQLGLDAAFYEALPHTDGAVNLVMLHGGIGTACGEDMINLNLLKNRGIDYLALGHIHKRAEPLTFGGTVCAWPGCPEGRGFDELGEKGFYSGTIDDSGKVSLTFVPFARRRYEILTVDVTDQDPRAAIEAALPADTAQDLYRILLTGETGEGGVHTDALKAALADRFYALELRDRTRLAEDLWAKAEEDSLRGLFLRDLKQQLAQAQTEEDRQRVTMAARFGLAALDHRDLG